MYISRKCSLETGTPSDQVHCWVTWENFWLGLLVVPVYSKQRCHNSIVKFMPHHCTYCSTHLHKQTDIHIQILNPKYLLGVDKTLSNVEIIRGKRLLAGEGSISGVF